MYVCGDGHIFDEPVLLKEDYYDRGEKLYGCPICGQGYDEIDEEEEDINLYEIKFLKEENEGIEEDIERIKKAITILNNVVNCRKGIKDITDELELYLLEFDLYIKENDEKLKELE